jgi:hypothetical protein
VDVLLLVLFFLLPAVNRIARVAINEKKESSAASSAERTCLSFVNFSCRFILDSAILLVAHLGKISKQYRITAGFFSTYRGITSNR